VAEGQAVFWRYSSLIFSSLLHFSLAGGFSATRVMNVLQETNYLTGVDRNRTYKRLLETGQAVRDFMVSPLPHFAVLLQQGWGKFGIGDWCTADCSNSPISPRCTDRAGNRPFEYGSCTLQYVSDLLPSRASTRCMMRLWMGSPSIKSECPISKSILSAY
jgi:hypothetical protein